ADSIASDEGKCGTVGLDCQAAGVQRGATGCLCLSHRIWRRFLARGRLSRSFEDETCCAKGESGEPMKILIVSDIHANWPALSAVVAEEPYDRLICLGDIVDYGPHPRLCLAYIRQHADWVIRGNHDNALGFGVDCGCRGDFRELSVSTRAWHRTLVH